MKCANHRSAVALGAIAFLAALGMLGILRATHWGPGFSPDSAFYLGGADSLLTGKGFVMPGPNTDEPITRFPPLYPALIAVLAWGGLRLLDAARWLNAAFFAANVFLVGLAVRGSLRRAAGSPWPSIVAAAVILTSPTLLLAHSMAWSEPPFLFLWLLGAMTLVAYQNTSRRRHLFISAACGALLLLTRYAGAPLVAASIVALLIFGVHSWYRRIADAMLYFLLAWLPCALFLFRNSHLTGAPTDRIYAWRPLDTTHLAQFYQTLDSWLLLPTGYISRSVTQTLITVGVLATAAIAVWEVRRAVSVRPSLTTGQKVGISSVLALSGAMYMAFLCASIMLIDPYTQFDARILSPALLAAIVIVLHAVDVALLRTRFAGYTMLALIALFVLRESVAGALVVQRAHANGLGYNTPAWQHSEFLKTIAHLPPGVAVYSNRPEVVFLHTGRPFTPLPEAQPENRAYASQMAALAEHVRAGAAIAYFQRIGKPSMPMEQELLNLLPLAACVSTTDGTIYAFGEQQPRSLVFCRDPNLGRNLPIYSSGGSGALR